MFGASMAADAQLLRQLLLRHAPAPAVIADGEEQIRHFFAVVKLPCQAPSPLVYSVPKMRGIQNNLKHGY